MDSQGLYGLKHGTEFDEAVAHDAWVGCTAVSVFRLEILKDFFPVFFLYVNDMIFNSVISAEFFALLYVVFFSGTKTGFLHFDFVAVLVFINDGSVPQAHGDTDHAASSFLEQNGSQC